MCLPHRQHLSYSLCGDPVTLNTTFQPNTAASLPIDGTDNVLVTGGQEARTLLVLLTIILDVSIPGFRILVGQPQHEAVEVLQTNKLSRYKPEGNRGPGGAGLQ